MPLLATMPCGACGRLRFVPDTPPHLCGSVRLPFVVLDSPGSGSDVRSIAPFPGRRADAACRRMTARRFAFIERLVAIVARAGEGEVRPAAPSPRDGVTTSAPSWRYQRPSTPEGGASTTALHHNRERGAA